MKKITTFLLLTFIIATLVSCSEDKSSNAKNDSSKASNISSTKDDSSDDSSKTDNSSSKKDESKDGESDTPSVGTIEITRNMVNNEKCSVKIDAPKDWHFETQLSDGCRLIKETAYPSVWIIISDNVSKAESPTQLGKYVRDKVISDIEDASEVQEVKKMEIGEFTVAYFSYTERSNKKFIALADLNGKFYLQFSINNHVTDGDANLDMEKEMQTFFKNMKKVP